MKTKKIIYLILTIFLGLMLSFIIHAWLEMFIIKSAFAQGKMVKGSIFFGIGWCALPFWAQFTFPILGIVGGYFLGQTWWRIVYIEKRHWRLRKNK